MTVTQKIINAVGPCLGLPIPLKEPFISDKQKAREDLERIIYRTKKFYHITDGDVISILENIKELWEWNGKQNERRLII